MATLSLPSLDAPCGPKWTPRHSVLASDPRRTAAFVFDLDVLFEVARYEAARARAVARSLARERQLDPLWTQIFALELATSEGGEAAIETLLRLTGRPQLAAEDPALAGIGIEPVAGAEAALETLRARFKLACVSLRPLAEAERILTALGFASRFDVVDLGADGNGLYRRVLGGLCEASDSCVLVARLGSPALDLAPLSGMHAVALSASRRDPVSPLAELVLPGFAHLEGLGAGAAAKYASGFRHLFREA